MYYFRLYDLGYFEVFYVWDLIFDLVLVVMYGIHYGWFDIILRGGLNHYLGSVMVFCCWSQGLVLVLCVCGT